MVEIKWRFALLKSGHIWENLLRYNYEMINSLKQFPMFGRNVPEYSDPSLREIIYKNYRIIYLVKHKHLEIISVIHGSRKL